MSQCCFQIKTKRNRCVKHKLVTRGNTPSVFSINFLFLVLQWDNRYRLQLLSNKRTQCNDKPTNEQR